MSDINFTLIPLSDLRNIITEVITKSLAVYDSKKIENSEPITYVTRLEVAKRLRISLPTLNSLTKEGKLQSYRIGRRVLYKHHEIEESFDKVSFGKYKRS